MGLMDKVKQGAGQALTKAQQGVNQGKAKLDQAQAKHQWDGLLRNLGAAVYAEQRQGGPADAVTAALSALDEHATTNGAPTCRLTTPMARSATTPLTTRLRPPNSGPEARPRGQSWCGRGAGPWATARHYHPTSGP